MTLIKKLLSIVLCIFLLGTSIPPALAVGILPPAPEACEMNAQGKIEDEDLRKAVEDQGGFDAYVTGGESRRDRILEVLGCAVKFGKVRLFMIPFFITSLIQLLLSIAGLVAVLFVVVGGFKYTVGGLTEDKESGKKFIQNALIGLVVALSAWIVINFIQVALTT